MWLGARVNATLMPKQAGYAASVLDSIPPDRVGPLSLRNTSVLGILCLLPGHRRGQPGLFLLPASRSPIRKTCFHCGRLSSIHRANNEKLIRLESLSVTIGAATCAREHSEWRFSRLLYSGRAGNLRWRFRLKRRTSKTMKKPASLFIVALSACLLTCLPAKAEEISGGCNIHPSDLLASFGFSATGTNLAANALIPAGPFAQVGTATGTSATQNGNSISGRWTVTISQNDSSGKFTTHTFVGNYSVDEATCTGDFTWDNIGTVFRATFVNHAKEFKSVSTLPGVIIAYTGRKL